MEPSVYLYLLDSDVLCGLRTERLSGLFLLNSMPEVYLGIRALPY